MVKYHVISLIVKFTKLTNVFLSIKIPFSRQSYPHIVFQLHKSKLFSSCQYDQNQPTPDGNNSYNRICISFGKRRRIPISNFAPINAKLSSEYTIIDTSCLRDCCLLI